MVTKKQQEPDKQEQQVAAPVRMKAEVVEDEANVNTVEETVQPVQPEPATESAIAEPQVQEPPTSETPDQLPPLAAAPQGAVEQPATPPWTTAAASQAAPSLMDAPSAETPQEQRAPQENTIVKEVKYDNSMGGLDSNVPLEMKNRRMFGIGIFLLVVILAGLALVLYQRIKLPSVATEQQTVEVQPGEVEESTPTPTPTPEPGLERSEITVEVLNGSGVTGAAGVFADKLEALGYELGEIGNASATDENELYVQEDLEEELSVLLQDLKDELGITKVTGYLDDSEATARVVLGVPLEEEEEVEATESGTAE